MKNTPDIDEEVSLSQVFSAVKNGIISFFLSIWNVFLFSFKNFWTFAITVIIGTGIGFGIHLLIKPVYTTDLTLVSYRLTNDHCAQLIGTLEELANHEENAPVLAKLLNLTTEEAEQINEIEYRNMNDKMEKLYSDSVLMNLPFLVRAEVHDTSILDKLQIGIVGYIENNEYSVKRKKLARQTLELMKAEVARNVKQLDSLKKIVDQSIIPRGTGTGIILGEPINPVNVYDKAIDMYRSELKIQEDIALLSNIEVMENFTKFVKPTWPKLWLDLLLGGIGGYLLGLIWIFNFRKK